MTTTTAGPGLRARKPSTDVALPLVLLEGPEKSGKTLAPVVLSRSDRFGVTYWLDLGEATADEYASLPGADYLVLEHDGTFRDILEQVTAVWQEADRARAAGEPPVILVIDSISALWTMLVNWTNERARRSAAGQKLLAADPDADVDAWPSLWDDANTRHARIVDLLKSFPGLAIVTARASTNPETGIYRVESQKHLTYNVDAWVRLQRDPRGGFLVGARTLRLDVEDAGPVPMPTTRVGSWDVVDLETFLLDPAWIGATVGATRDVVKLHGDERSRLEAAVNAATTVEALEAVWEQNRDRVSADNRPGFTAHVTERLNALRAAQDGQQPTGEAEPSLNAHGPTSDAEKLRQAAEQRAADGDGPHDGPTLDEVGDR